MRSFRSHNNKGQSVIFSVNNNSSCLKTRPKSCWVHYQGKVCLSIDSEALVFTSTWQEHEWCRFAQPNFPARSKRHRNAYHLKQRLYLPQNQVTLELMGSYCLQGLWNVGLQARSTDDDQCTRCKEAARLEVCRSPLRPPLGTDSPPLGTEPFEEQQLWFSCT